MKPVECTRKKQFEWFIVLFRINSLISEPLEYLTYTCICTVSALRLIKSLNLVIVKIKKLDYFISQYMIKISLHFFLFQP